MPPSGVDGKLFGCVNAAPRLSLEPGVGSKLRFLLLKTDENISGDDLLRNSSLYREFQAERDEILRHKWLESEKAGRDIGFEAALTDWIIKHRSKWRRGRKSSQARTD